MVSFSSFSGTFHVRFTTDLYRKYIKRISVSKHLIIMFLRGQTTDQRFMKIAIMKMGHKKALLIF